MACSANPVMSNSQMRDFVYNNFGITVRTSIVTLSNGAVGQSNYTGSYGYSKIIVNEIPHLGIAHYGVRAAGH